MDVGVSSSGGRRLTRPCPTVPPAVVWIAKRLERAGFETWAVGGAVRDVLLGIDSVDWDLATRARPEQIRRVFQKVVPIGIEHGTVGVLTHGGEMYEVTTFRRDVETHGRHATVEFANEIDEDLARRDFTINAVAWRPLSDELYDPFDGVPDLERRLLRTVGNPDDRFAEDYLRVLRALRFAGRFELTIDRATWAALCAATGQLGILSPERVREELLKILGLDPMPSQALSLYVASGALDVLLYELRKLVGVSVRDLPVDEWTYALMMTDTLSARRPVVRLAALLQGIGPRPAARLLMRLRFSNAQTDWVAAVARAGAVPPVADAPPADLRRWLARTDVSLFRELARIWCARERLERDLGGAHRVDVVGSWRSLRRELRMRPALSVGDLAVDGNDLIRMGLKPGPRFGRILHDLLECVLDDPELNRRETLLQLAAEVADGRASAG